MPGLSISFTEDELERVRGAAARDGLSLKAYAHNVVVAVASSDRIADIATGVAARSKELNERLAQ
ncbi:MAG: antitoxin Phd [Dermatophilaceae bacterium]